MKQVVRFETTDGQLFQTDKEATSHEAQLSIGRRVTAYVESLSAKPPASTRLTNDLSRFLNWELDQIHADTIKAIAKLDKDAA